MKFEFESQTFDMDLVTLEAGECDLPREIRRSFALRGLAHTLLQDVYNTTPSPEHTVFSVNGKARKLGDVAVIACHVGAHNEVVQCVRRLCATVVEQVPDGALELAAHHETMKILAQVAYLTKQYRESEMAEAGGGEDCTVTE